MDVKNKLNDWYQSVYILFTKKPLLPAKTIRSGLPAVVVHFKKAPEKAKGIFAQWYKQIQQLLK